MLLTINGSYFNYSHFKAACHADLSAEQKWYIQRHIFGTFLITDLTLWIHRPWYSPLLFIMNAF